MILFPEYPRLLPNLQSFRNPLESLRSCHIASIATTPAACASTGIFPLEYFSPCDSLVYSTPISFRRSNTPKTTAETLFSKDAML